MPSPMHDSVRSLRESLLAPPRPQRAAVVSATVEEPLLPGERPPSPAELLASSPNLQRLCDSYNRLHRHLLQRSRRQKIGLAAMVATLGVATVLVSRNGHVPPQVLANLIIAVGATSCAALGVLAMLWMRDENRLRTAQAERMIRAVQLNCNLPEARVRAWRRQNPATATFYECYRIWAAQHHTPDGPIANALALFSQTWKRAAAAH